MLKFINHWYVIAGLSSILFIFVMINAWHIRIKWDSVKKRFKFCYRVLHIIHEIDYKDHFEFEDREKALPKLLNVFRWKRKKDCVMMKEN